MSIRISFCLNSGAKAGQPLAPIVVTDVSTESLVAAATKKFRLKKKDAANARLFLWVKDARAGTELPRDGAADMLRNDDLIAVSVGEAYTGPKPPELVALASALVGDPSFVEVSVEDPPVISGGCAPESSFMRGGGSRRFRSSGGGAGGGSFEKRRQCVEELLNGCGEDLDDFDVREAARETLQEMQDEREAGKDDRDAVKEIRHRQCVEELFDEYAEDFERHLVQGLRYDIPAVLQARVPQRKYARCIDLGCGTGLSGEVFRDRCGHMEGVDVSSNMTAKAEESGHYDEVHCRDVVAHLRRQEAGSVDLIIAADVLVYVYSMERLFAEVGRTLSVGGVFGFSTEKATDEETAGKGVVERDTERFAHSRSYVLGLAEAHGLELTSVDEAPIRLGEGGPIPGEVFVLTRVCAAAAPPG